MESCIRGMVFYSVYFSCWLCCIFVNSLLFERKIMKKIKKRKTKSPIIKLHERANKLWKEYAFLRDGKECQVKKRFPHIQIAHTKVLQVDHFITRGNRNLFYDTRNSTVVCGSCNFAKKFKQKSVDRAIDDIVKQREGEDVFNEMVEKDHRNAPNSNWTRIWYLEEIIIGLNSQINYLKHHKEML